MLIARPAHESQNVGGEDLHVAGEDDEVDSVVGEGGGHLGLLGCLVAVDDGEVAVVDTEPLGHLGVVGMVADHHRNVDRQVATAATVKKVVEAVRLSRDEHRDARSLVGEAQRPTHREPLQLGFGGGGDLVPRQRETVELELDPLEERTVGVVGVLLEIDDVAAVSGDERRPPRRRCRGDRDRRRAGRRWPSPHPTGGTVVGSRRGSASDSSRASGRGESAADDERRDERWQDVAVTSLTMLCTDGSDLATEALAAGLRLLAPADRTLVVTVVESVDASLMYGASGLAGGVIDEQEYADMVGAQRDAADTILRGAVTALGLDGVATVETLAAEGGDPGRALCDLAAERGATVIVAGSRGRGGLKRAVLGSVSDHLVRNAPCPVLVSGAGDR